MEGDKYVLRLENASCWHPYEKTGMEKVNLRLEQKAFVCIYGTIGSGIADLYDILAGKRKVQDGSFSFFGTVHVIPEHFPYFPYMTVRDYLLMPDIFTGKSKDKAWKRRKDSLKKHWLWRKRTMGVQFLSGFERGVLMAWNAFYGDPDVVVIGNCMQYMDAREKKMFWEEIAEFRRKGKAACVCISDEICLPVEAGLVYRMTDGKLIREEEF